MTDTRVSTGVDSLDEVIQGGIPGGRTVVVQGGAGTGKTTFSLGFVQDGLEKDENCLFITTEQTHEELCDSFEGFDFDLTHENLTVVSIHAVPGNTFEEDTELTLTTLENEEIVDDFNIPFEVDRILEHLDEYTPQDRIVLDSVSGLGAVASDVEEFRHAIIDIIRQFSDVYDATSLLVSESDDRTSVLQRYDILEHTAHGIIDLWNEEVRGDYHRFLRVPKMRGTDHDHRKRKFVINPEGVEVGPRRRSFSVHSGERYGFLGTGVEGFDDVLGGGLIRDRLSIWEHDGDATLYPFLMSTMTQALSDGMAAALTLPSEFDRDALDRYWEEEEFSVEELLDDDRLFLMEAVREPQGHHDNVYVFEEYDNDLTEIARDIYSGRDGVPMFAAVDLEPVLQKIPPDEVRNTRYEAATNRMEDSDVVVYVGNRKVSDEPLIEFLNDISAQTVEMWQDSDGMQYLRCKKSPRGKPGDSRVIDYVDEKPYVKLL